MLFFFVFKMRIGQAFSPTTIVKVKCKPHRLVNSAAVQLNAQVDIIKVRFNDFNLICIITGFAVYSTLA